MAKSSGPGSGPFAPDLRSRSCNESPDSPPFRGLDPARNAALLAAEHFTTGCEGRRCRRYVSVLTPLSVDGEVRGITGMTIAGHHAVPVMPNPEPAGPRYAPQSDLPIRGIAHDLNNLLAVLHMNAELAIAETDRARVLEHMEAICEGTLRGRELTGQLRTPPADSDDPGTLSLHGVVTRFTQDYALTLPSTVRLALEITTECTIRAERSQVVRILLNLLTNAVHAVDHHGRIRVRVGTSGEQPGLAQLTVEDDGGGIPNGDVLRLFEPFHTTRSNGMGLGLWIVYHLVDVLGGTLRVSGRTNAGTRVDVLFPMASAPPA